MKRTDHEQQRREEQQRQAEERPQNREQEHKLLPQKQAMSHLGQEKQGAGRQAPIKSRTPGNARGRKQKD